MEQVSTMKPWPALRCVPGSLLLSVTENLSEQEFHLMLKPKDTGRTLYILEQVSTCTQLIEYEIYQLNYKLFARNYFFSTCIHSLNTMVLSLTFHCIG